MLLNLTLVDSRTYLNNIFTYLIWKNFYYFTVRRNTDFLVTLPGKFLQHSVCLSLPSQLLDVFFLCVQKKNLHFFSATISFDLNLPYFYFKTLSTNASILWRHFLFVCAKKNNNKKSFRKCNFP